MHRLLLTIAGVVLFGVCCGTMPKAPADAPPLGWTTHCRIVSVIDGDTLDVEVKRTIRVRLLACYSPESRTKDLAEKSRGLAAKEHMESAAVGCDALLHVPGGKDTKDLTTLGRVLGHVWLLRSDGKPDGESLSEMQVRNGHAVKEKQ